MRRFALFLSALLLLSLTALSGAQETSGTPIDFSGTVDSIDGATLVVAGLTVDVSRVDPAIVAQLQTGMNITVGGTLADGIVMADVLVLPEPAAEPQTVAPSEADDDAESSPNVRTEPNYTVSLDGRTFNGTQTTFTYTVTGSGVPTALSHFNIELPACSPQLDLIGFFPTEAVDFGVDPTTGVDGIKWDLPLGESESRSYSLTFDGFVAQGTVTTAVKNGDGYFTVAVGGPSCTQPSVDIEKFVSAAGSGTWADADSAPGLEIPAGGQVIYRLVITNDGNVPLTDLVLTEPLANTSACVIPAELAPDTSFECVLPPVAATEAQLTNTAIINASYQGMTVGDSDSANYFTGALPSVAVEKYIAVGDDLNWVDADSAPGIEVQPDDVVYFRFVVTNDGNVPLTGVALSDDRVDTSSCAIPAMLETGASADCVVGPLPTVEGQHTNTATVIASGNSSSVQASDTANYIGRSEPLTAGNFTIAFLGSVYANGQTTFSYGVVGNSTPPDLSHFNLEIPICPTPLQVAVYSPTDAVSFGIDPTTGVNGIKWDLPLLSTSSRTYSITFEGNVALGAITAAVKAGNGFDAIIVPGPACDVAQIAVEKDISLNGGASWLDADNAPGPDADLNGQVAFRFRVSNEGNSALADITLTDDTLDLSSCAVPSQLAAGASFDCVVGALPVIAGQHSNTATARGTFADGSGTTVDSDSAHYFGGDRPEITVEGYVSSNGGASWVDADAAPGLIVEVGGDVALRYVLTNTGNVALSGLTLSATFGDVSRCALPATLAPDTRFECLAGNVTASAGQQTDRVTATAIAASIPVEDSDNSRFFGGDLDDDDDIIIVIEGPVEDIDGNTIVIFGLDIVLDPDDPRLTVIQIGDIIRIEGGDEGGILIALVFVFTDVEIFVNNGIVWRDRGNCGNPPPPWAPAWGWRARCEGGGVTVIITGGGGVPAGCKLTGIGNGNIRIKCSRDSRRSS